MRYEQKHNACSTQGLLMLHNHMFRVSWVSGRLWSYQVIIWFDAKQIPEVTEGQRGVGFEAEIRIVVCRRQVTSLTGMCNE